MALSSDHLCAVVASWKRVFVIRSKGTLWGSASVASTRCWFWAFLSSWICIACVCVQADSVRPNVVVILADDLGWPDLGVQGSKDLHTPNIDSIAGQGLRFRNAYVVSPICSPSRAGLMSGRYPQRFGHEVNPGPLLETNVVFGLPLTESTMGNRMKALGYTTGWIGKSHLGGAEPYWPLQRGFDEFFGFLEGHHDYTYPYELTPGDPIRRGSTPVLVTNYLTSEFSKECVDFIDRHATAPFFLYAPFNAVHFPMQAPAEYLEKFDPADFGGLTPRYTNAAMLAVLDDAVGDILARLRAHHIESNTVVIFTSDNGAPTPGRVDQNGSINTPLRGFKGGLYEGGIRVPFLMQWKGTIPTGVVDAVVSTLDILPTAVAAAGASVPSAWQLDGKNLLPFLTGRTSDLPHAQLFWRMDTEGGDDILPGPRAVRSGDWKLVKPSITNNWELYDLQADISESHNLATDRPDIVRELVEAFDTWDQQMGSPAWDFNTPDYVEPNFWRQDLRIGSATMSYESMDILGDENPRLAWVDANDVLWSAFIDPSTGFLKSSNGQERLVDTGITTPATPYDRAVRWGVASNGPALFYSKPGNGGHLQLWRSTDSANGAGARLLTSSAMLDSFAVRPSVDITASVTRLLFDVGSLLGNPAVVWATESNANGATPLLRPLAGGVNGSWIPGSVDVVYSGFPLVQSPFPQLIRWSTETATGRALTSDPGVKTSVCAFKSPVLDGELLYASVIDGTRIAIYRETRPGTQGGFSNIFSFTLPVDVPQRFVSALEPMTASGGFNGVSYLVFSTQTSTDPANSTDGGIWLFGLGPDTDHPILRRLDSDPEESSAIGLVSKRNPVLVAGRREVYCYYIQSVANGPKHLHLARTGVELPDHEGSPSGFSSLEFTDRFSGGDVDPRGRAMNNTETTFLVSHNGWMFAGQGSFMDPNIPTDITNPPVSWSGAQILVKKSQESPWTVDYTSGLDPFPFHMRVEALVEVAITTDGDGNPVSSQGGRFLLSSMRDIGDTGARAASTRMREDSTGIWKESHVTTASSEAYPVSYASHRDGRIHRVFTGLSNGQIHRGNYNSTSRNLSWVTNAEFNAGGAVLGLSEANGKLYAASALVQSSSNGPVQGGLFVRDDSNATWKLVYRWPYPLDLHSRSGEVGKLRGLCAVPDPRGDGHEVLLGARSWPGVIERIDPTQGHAVTVEIDVREFLARVWRTDRVRATSVVLSYQGFTPAKDPVTGEQVQLTGLRVLDPDLPVPGFRGALYLIRHLDASYELAEVPNDLPTGTLRATRAIGVSPFVAEGSSLYFGGYDVAADPSHNTAWILRGDWVQWPVLSITRPLPPSWQLAWVNSTTNWVLETKSTLQAAEPWQPVPDLSTRSLTRQTLSLPHEDAGAFYRLRQR